MTSPEMTSLPEEDSSNHEAKKETTTNFKSKVNKSKRISAFFTKLFTSSSTGNLATSSPKAKRKTIKKPTKDITDVVKLDFGVEETEKLKHVSKPKPPQNRRRPKKSAKISPVLPEVLEEECGEDGEKVARMPILTPKSPPISIVTNDTTEKKTQSTDELSVELRKGVINELSRSLSSRSKSLSYDARSGNGSSRNGSADFLNNRKSRESKSSQESNVSTGSNRGSTGSNLENLASVRRQSGTGSSGNGSSKSGSSNRSSENFAQRMRNSQNSSDGIENPTSL